MLTGLLRKSVSRDGNDITWQPIDTHHPIEQIQLWGMKAELREMAVLFRYRDEAKRFAGYLCADNIACSYPTEDTGIMVTLKTRNIKNLERIFDTLGQQFDIPRNEVGALTAPKNFIGR